jgi:hypothetical protein
MYVPLTEQHATIGPCRTSLYVRYLNSISQIKRIKQAHFKMAPVEPKEGMLH